MTKVNSLCTVLLAVIACSIALGFSAHAQETKPAPQVEAPAADAATPSEPVELEQDVEAEPEQPNPRFRNYDNRKVIVHFGHDSYLPANEQADAMVSIVGSSTSEGQIKEAVVSIFGNSRATGPVGQDVVAVFGDVYVNNSVRGDVVAVFGSVELGAQADVGGEVTAVGGSIKRDPAASIERGLNEVVIFGDWVRLEWLRPWLKHCLLYGRPLALEPGLGWAWTLAFGFLALYVILGLMFPGSLEKCVETLETRPGSSLVAALLTVLLTPVLMLLLTVTVIGIPAIPFVFIGLFCAGLFGKAVVLATIGRRLTGIVGTGLLSDIAFAVLVGGFVVLGLYLVPVIGFIAFKLIAFVGLGVVIYTMLLTFKARRESRPPPPAYVAPAPAAPMSDPAAASTASNEAAPEPAAATMSATTAATPTPASPSALLALPRAGFWIRMGALFIDAVLIGVAVNFLDDSGGASLLALGIYGAVMWKIKGTTIGGLLCNLQVVRLDGREIDWNTAIIRALSCFLSLAVAGLGFIWIAFDDQRQAWHDKIAGTAVVRAPHGVSLT